MRCVSWASPSTGAVEHITDRGMEMPLSCPHSSPPVLWCQCYRCYRSQGVSVSALRWHASEAWWTYEMRDRRGETSCVSTAARKVKIDIL